MAWKWSVPLKTHVLKDWFLMQQCSHVGPLEVIRLRGLLIHQWTCPVMSSWLSGLIRRWSLIELSRSLVGMALGDVFYFYFFLFLSISWLTSGEQLSYSIVFSAMMFLACHRPKSNGARWPWSETMSWNNPFFFQVVLLRCFVTAIEK
jgi:hypothetical protein